VTTENNSAKKILSTNWKQGEPLDLLPNGLSEYQAFSACFSDALLFHEIY
jgi:hypothetical protein